MIKAPPVRKLRALMLKTVKVTKYTYSGSEDAYGQKQVQSSVSFTIKAEIQEVTAEDISLLAYGEVKLGDAWGFFLPSYVVEGKTIKIEPGDEIEWNNKRWRVDYVEDYYIGETLLFKRAFLRRVI